MPKKTSKKPANKPARDLSKKAIECPTCGGKGKIANPATIGDTLKKERMAAGVKQETIAAELKIGANSLSMKESGKRKLSEQEIADYRAAIAKHSKK